ncbi:NAD(P)H-hydrate dehydratase, partial [Oxalobacteraceae bacterium OM1]
MPVSQPLYTVAEIRAIEHAALAAAAPGTLMQRAGAAAAEQARHLLQDRQQANVLVLAGPGNNGGDAIECASLLQEADYRPVVLHTGDPGRLPADASAAYARAQRAGVRFVALSAWRETLQDARWDLIIDGLFGIGLARPIEGEVCALVEAVNGANVAILALDVPSGLDADTGNIIGVDGVAVHASHTITFLADKPGLHTGHGRDYAGTVAVASLDVAAALYPPATMHLSGPHAFGAHLTPRSHASHKGTYGDVAVTGGAHGMTGAAILAARAAAKCGAGRVFGVFLDAPPSHDPIQPELMFRNAEGFDFGNKAIVLGPGLGTSAAAAALVGRALAEPAPAVIDADALNLIAADSSLQQGLTQRGRALLTPHPLEAARLLATSAVNVQSDRLAAARSLAVRLRSVVVLKGSGTIIARPDGMVAINPTGNPALATAGCGDVLAGICGALLAQGWPE